MLAGTQDTSSSDRMPDGVVAWAQVQTVRELGPFYAVAFPVHRSWCVALEAQTQWINMPPFTSSVMPVQ